MRPIRLSPAPTTIDMDRTPVRKLEFVEVKPGPVRVAAVTATADKEPGLTPQANARRRGKRNPGAGVEGAAWPLPSPAVTETVPDPARPVSEAEPGWSLWSDLEV